MVQKMIQKVILATIIMCEGRDRKKRERKQISK